MVNQSFPRLLCSIGVGDYASIAYRLDDRTYSSRFAPVALARLLDLPGGKASVLVTPRAREKESLITLGIGAKTAVGYGLFVSLERGADEQ